MFLRVFYRTLIIAMLIGICGSVWAQSLSVVNEKYNEFAQRHQVMVKENLPEADRRSLILKSYLQFRRGVAREHLAKFTNADLPLLFRAAHEASFYAPDTLYAEDMAETVKELQKRGVNVTVEVKKTHAALIASRSFKAALDWRLANGIAPVFNDLASEKISQELSHSATLIRMTADVPRREKIDVPNGLFIIVIAHPSCHFSRFAIADFSTDPALKALLMAQQTMWISPQQLDENLSATSEWNRQYPNAQLAQAFRTEEWTDIASWETPTFYIFYDRRLSSKVVGWPREGRKAALLDAIAKAKNSRKDLEG